MLRGRLLSCWAAAAESFYLCVQSRPVELVVYSVCLRHAACLFGQYGSGEYFAEAVDVQSVEDRGYGRGGRHGIDRVNGVPGMTAAQKTGPG